MFVNYEINDRLLEVVFEEEIDHHSCLKLAIMIDDCIKKYMPQTVLFDFEKVTFMDSSGIGMLLGRYKKIIRLAGQAEMINLNGDLRRIFEMSGILKIIPIREEIINNGK